jgi:Rod binding domain-containing protein
MIGESSSVSASIIAAAVPAEVKKEGAEAVDNYKSALQFEGMLVKEMLTDALPEEMGGTGGEGSGGEGEEGGAFSYNPQLSSMPETVANSIVSGGGLGLAKEMYKSFGGAS